MVAYNRLKVGDQPARIDEVLVCNIACVPTQEGWLHLAGVLNPYSRRLIGWAIGSGFESALPLAVLLMVLRPPTPASGRSVLHSDRAYQYAALQMVASPP